MFVNTVYQDLSELECLNPSEQIQRQEAIDCHKLLQFYKENISQDKVIAFHADVYTGKLKKRCHNVGRQKFPKTYANYLIFEQ